MGNIATINENLLTLSDNQTRMVNTMNTIADTQLKQVDLIGDLMKRVKKLEEKVRVLEQSSHFH